MINKFLKHEKGITGLETAIILIAFVVVAAVFAYTVLSAGLFSTQKGQEAVYSGLKEAQSTLELRGDAIATANVTGASGTVKQVSFVVACVLGGQPIDFTEPTADTHTGIAAAGSNNKVVINYVDQNQSVGNLYWTYTALGANDGSPLLSGNEKFQITIGSDTAGQGAGNLEDALTTQLGVNQTFTIEVVPPQGAVLTIERTTPAYLDAIADLR